MSSALWLTRFGPHERRQSHSYQFYKKIRNNGANWLWQKEQTKKWNRCARILSHNISSGSSQLARHTSPFTNERCAVRTHILCVSTAMGNFFVQLIKVRHLISATWLAQHDPRRVCVIVGVSGALMQCANRTNWKRNREKSNPKTFLAYDMCSAFGRSIQSILSNPCLDNFVFFHRLFAFLFSSRRFFSLQFFIVRVNEPIDNLTNRTIEKKNFLLRNVLCCAFALCISFCMTLAQTNVPTLDIITIMCLRESYVLTRHTTHTQRAIYKLLLFVLSVPVHILLISNLIWNETKRNGMATRSRRARSEEYKMIRMKYTNLFGVDRSGHHEREAVAEERQRNPNDTKIIIIQSNGIEYET